MRDYKKPHCPLSEIKKLLQNEDSRVITSRCINDAYSLGYVSDEQIVGRCLSLTLSEFHVSVTHDSDNTLWLDSYVTQDEHFKIYIKFQKNHDGNAVIISFHETD